MGNGLQGVLLPVRAAAEEYSSFAIGIMGSAYFVGFAAGCLLGAHIVVRVGHIRSFAALVAACSVLPLIHGIITEELVWWIARAGTGFCFAGLYMIIESWLNEKATNESRGFVFSVYTVINLTVVTIGQMMVTLSSVSTLLLFALASMLLSVSAIPVALTTASAPASPAIVRLRLRHLAKISPVGVVGCFGVGLTNGSFWSLAPVFAQTDVTDTTRVASFMSIVVIAGAIAQWPIGFLSDKMDRRRVIIGTCAAAAAAGIGLVFASQAAQVFLYVGAAAFGLSAFPIYSLCAAHLNDVVEDDGFVEASSGLLLVYAAGAIVGPLIASFTMRSTGVHALFMFTAGVHFLVGCFAVHRLTQRTAVIDEDRPAYSESVVMSQTILEIDPMESDGDQTPTATKELEKPH
ncbi:MAG: MFS transporter [Rhizobiales bacterium]|nr:MFS transporter [Hyphomicrobiales bacterium]